jgi:predicted Zn-dependent protease
LIVRHYPKHPERASILIVHEFGHLLGARHHGEAEECGEEECIMEGSGYILTNEWCHHHLEVIEENIKSRLGHSIS